MANFKRYRTNSLKSYFNSRLIADPVVTTLPSGTKLLKVRIVDGTTSDRHIDLFTEVSVNIDKRPFLAKLAKGDSIQTVGKEEYRMYTDKKGETRLNAEIRFPIMFEPLVDLRDRPDAGQPEPAEEPEADDASEEDDFFGDD